ncbi:MAG: alpha-glucosidase [Bacteroidia bacterium]
MDAAPKSSPDWWKRTSIYQIYPRSFQDSNGDGIGDLQGIISRLDYIKGLGIETIWISPFYASPQGDFGYDISDYCAVAPEYGTIADAEELIAAVHERGMKIVMDMVLNHTSEEHPWFLESRMSRDNPKADWYIWRDGKGADGKRPPNNWRSMIGPRGWQWSASRKQWYFASFLNFQPDLNYRNPEVKAAMFEVLRFWLRKGVDGFRLDIFNAIMKDADFRDNPFSWHLLPTFDGMNANFQHRLYTVNHPDNFQLAQEVRAVIDEFPGRFLVGEVFGQHPTIKRFLGEKQDGLNLIFLFDMLFFRFKPEFFRKRLEEYEEHYRSPLVPTFVMGNHDNKRSIGRVGGDLERAKALAILQMTTRGVPVVYYGEEIGMQDAEIHKSEAKDPLSRLYGWVPSWLRRLMPVPLNRDVSRTPMRWDSGPNAGFCREDVGPWLPISEGLSERNVATQSDRTDSLMQAYRELLALRKQHSVLVEGDLELIAAENLPASVLGFRRRLGSLEATVLVHFGRKATRIPDGIVSGAPIFAMNWDSINMTFKGLGGVILFQSI